MVESMSRTIEQVEEAFTKIVFKLIADQAELLERFDKVESQLREIILAVEAEEPITQEPITQVEVPKPNLTPKGQLNALVAEARTQIRAIPISPPREAETSVFDLPPAERVRIERERGLKNVAKAPKLEPKAVRKVAEDGSWTDSTPDLGVPDFPKG
jgi:hypothetical protein